MVGGEESGYFGGFRVVLKLGNGDSLVRGISLAYSQLVEAYYSNKIP